MPTPASALLPTLACLPAQIFIAGLWQGLVLMAVVSLALRLLPRLAASARFAVWTLAFSLAAALPLLHRNSAASTFPRPPATALHLSPAWGLAIAALWLALSAARALELAFAVIHLRRIWQRATPLAPDPTIAPLLQAGRRTAQLCASLDVDAPAVIGFFAPRLLLPQALLPQLTPAELRHIVLHECEHLRRNDDWTNLLQKLGLALFPLNPALLWVDRRLSLERELASDAGVVAATAAPLVYASCLTRLAGLRLRTRALALALSAWSSQPGARQSELARRVYTLLRPGRAASRLGRRLSVAGLGLTLAGAAFELAHAPQFISFTGPSPIASVTSPALPAPATHSPANSAPAQAIPVLYRDSATPRMTLLRAALPTAGTTSLQPARSPEPKPRHATPKLQHAIPELQPANLCNLHAPTKIAQPRMILTTAAEATQTQSQPQTRTQTQNQTRRAAHAMPRAVYTLDTDFSPTFAAVPFGDGWLILQL